MKDFMTRYEEAQARKAKRESQIVYVPTNYTTLDAVLGGGLPLGKVVEIAGEAGIGKSALSHDFIAQAQKKNLSCVLLDIERKFDAYWARERAGVNTDDLLIFEPEKVEGLPTACVALMENGLADVIIIDSVSALDLGDLALKDILNPILKNLVQYNTSLVLLSQTREDIKEHVITTPHNGALNDLCNVRIMLNKKQVLKIVDSADQTTIGKTLEVNVYKNDLAVPQVTFIDLFI